MANSATNEENLRLVSFHIDAKTAVSLDEDLKKMNGSERSSVLAANQYGDLGNPPLVYAVERGSLDIVNVLLKYKVDIEVGGKCQRLTRDLSGIYDNNIYLDGSNWFTYTCCTPLFLAAAYSHLDILRYLVENGADINACSDDHCTPLMIAIKMGHINVATYLVEHGAKVDLKDDRGCTALHHAMYYYHHDRLEVCSCLIERGADVNGCYNNKSPQNGRTPLMIASRYGQLDAMTFLIKQGANVNLQDKEGETALHYAVDGSDVSCEVLSCLIENGANFDAFSNSGCTPLMKAIHNQLIQVVTYLIEHGANIDLQDKNGNTALHHAVGVTNFCDIIDHLVTGGASHICNNQGLTPLLLVSDRGNVAVVEHLIKRPEITKEQRINALELLGASLVILHAAGFERSFEKGLKYIKHGMEERFSNLTEPLLKQSTEQAVKAYQNRKECQSLEEFAQMEGDLDTMVIESIVIRERIIGNESESLRYVTAAAGCYFHANRNFSTCLALYRHAVKIAQSSKQSADFQLDNMSRLLHEEFKRSGLPKVKNHLIELFELILLEYETQHKVKKPNSLSRLFDISAKVVFISKVEFHGESKRSNLSTMLKQLIRKDPQDRSGNTLLHKVIECHMDNEVYSCLDAVKLLLSAGFNVNAKNKKGNTPLHIAAKFKPRSGKICLVAEILQVLIDGGAHHDFVNNDSKTPVDMAKTDEACMILSESRNLELRCISARAVRKFGTPYLGVVPKTLEKYINMHSS